MEITLSNPYYQLTAIRSLDMFYGRQDVLRRFYEMLYERQSVSLIGPQGIGKSSFLYCASQKEMQACFPFDLSHHIFVPIDVREYLYKTGDDFFHAVCREIKFQCQRLFNLSLHSEGRGPDEFSNLLNEINNQGFYPVLLMDAFDNVSLNTHFGPEFFAFLRAYATFGKISYVTASIASLYEIAYRNTVDSPFANIFYSFRLGAFTEEEALALIKVPAEQAGMPFTPEEAEWVRKYAGLHPFLIQRVCFVLFEEKQLSSSEKVDLQKVRNRAYRDLLPYFKEIWQRMTHIERSSVQDDVQTKNYHERDIPELSESAFFRQFVRNTSEVDLFQMSVNELEEALDKMNDLVALGETNLRLMKAVTKRLDDNIPPTAAGKGKVIREVLNEALERLRGSGAQSDTAPDWKYYNILFYRYFRHQLKNNMIAERLGYIGGRQYYRDRSKAVEALRNVLLVME